MLSDLKRGLLRGFVAQYCVNWCRIPNIIAYSIFVILEKVIKKNLSSPGLVKYPELSAS